MKETFHRTIAPLLLFLICTAFSPTWQVKEKDLPERYREWLDLAAYIILPAEREVFFQLQTDRDRDIFIESFWKQRDPTPATVQNEFRDEHLRRFSYANTNLRRGTPREGWMTDMGRMYIILGEPNSIERFDSQPGVHPCQVWYYRGEARRGLPALFGLVFYQRGGSGEYKLYNPASDGPASLLIRPEAIDATNYQKVYEKIRELTPSLAPVVLSIIPGELPFSYTPSPQNSIILANIYESPRKDVNPRYATDFLSFKGLVSTDYLTNYVESSSVVSVIPDPILGIDFIHFSLSPKKVSVDYYEPEDRYYCNFQLNATLKKGEEIIFQHEKDFPLYFPPDRKSNIEANGIAVEDVIPAAEGEYELAILLQNTVGREFCYFETQILIPPRGGTALQLSGPLFGYRLRSVSSDALLPFKVLDRQISVDANDTIAQQDELAILFALSGMSETLWKDGQARIHIKGLKGEDATERDLVFRLSDEPYRQTISYGRAIPARELAPDYYNAELSIVDGDGNILLTNGATFIVSAVENVSHPVTLILPSPPATRHLLFYGLAYQYDKLGLPQKAEASYKQALALNAGYTRGIAEYAGFLVKIGKFDEALVVIERIRDDESLRFQYFLVKGSAFMGKEDYDTAIQLFLEGNKIYNSDVRLLNSLGNCYYRTGRMKEALDVLKASLSLNPEQKDIQELVDKIRIELE